MLASTPEGFETGPLFVEVVIILIRPGCDQLQNGSKMPAVHWVADVAGDAPTSLERTTAHVGHLDRVVLAR